MEKVIIVECISTSMNYVPDLRKLGYEPVILETYNDDGGKEEARRQANYVHMQKPLPKRIQAKPDYDETLELCRAENPVLLLPGSEMSVELATKLANDLGLPSNPKENLPQMTRKSEMHNALKCAGMRYIKGEMVSTLDEAMKFFHTHGDRPVVLKPTHSAGSLSVFVCTKEDEIAHGFNEILGGTDMFGGVNDKVLIQECIDGTEYIVNTVSRKGENYITAVYRYNKKQAPGGAKLYDYTENLREHDLTDEICEMMDYAQKTVKAIGIQYGPVHGEFFIDDKGPVLVEINCRICGGDMKAEFLDKQYGHHETDRSLEAYLDEDGFNKHKAEGYKTVGKGIFKTVITPEDMDIVDAPIVRITREMPTFVSAISVDEHTETHLPKTTNLYNNGGKFSFASSDEEQVKKDAFEICRLEVEDFGKLYTKKQ